jgi:uncharacterized protein (TIGR02246 family)
MAALDDAVTRIIDTYRSAVRARNADTLMHLYDPDVRVFDTWGIWSHDGAEKWRRAIEAWFSSLGSERVEASFDDVRVLGSTDFAAVSAIVTYAATSADGAPLRSMQNRISWALRTRGHVLRIVHEHSSVPIGFEDLKGILERPSGA